MEGDRSTADTDADAAWAPPQVRCEHSARSDAELVLGIAEGRPSALSAVYHRHHRAVRDLASRLCGPNMAEDIIQEVFLALWRSPESFDPERGSLRTYLLTKTRGKAIDQVRSEVARRTREANAMDACVTGHDASVTGNTVEYEVLSRLAGEEARELLGELPEGTRRAIVLAYFGRYTYRQVAALLEQPDGTVKSRIRSGLCQMRARLADDGPVSPMADKGCSTVSEQRLDRTRPRTS